MLVHATMKFLGRVGITVASFKSLMGIPIVLVILKERQLLAPVGLVELYVCSWFRSATFLRLTLEFEEISTSHRGSRSS
jgi:hypothetical protein